MRRAPKRGRQRQPKAPEKIATVRLARILVTILRGPLRLAGASPADVALILETKVILDFRRHKERPEGTGLGAINFAFTILLFFVVGLMAGALGTSLLSDASLYVAVTSAAVLFFVTLQMITDYTDVLLDTTDSAVIGPTPIHGRSVAAARILHIVIYLALLVGALVIPMIACGVLKYHLLVLVPLLATTVLSTLLALATTAILYLLILRFARPGIVNELVLFAQISGVLLVFGAMQLAPRMFKKAEQLEALRELVTTPSAIHYALPPMYYAGLYRVMSGNGSGQDWVLSALACLVPLLALLATVRGATRFGEQLTTLGAASSATPKRLSRFAKRGQRRGSGIRQATSDMVTALALRERGFRLRTIPALGMSIIVTLAIFLTPEGDFSLIGKIQLCTLVYIMSLFASTFVQQARFGDHPDAAWVYRAAPIAIPGSILAGFTRAICLRFLAPLVVIMSGVAMAMGGITLLPDVIFASLATILLTLLTVLLWRGFLPFSEKFTRPIFSSSIGPFTVFTFVAGALVALHFLLRLLPGGIYAGIAIELAVAAWLYAMICRMKVPALASS
ncbi:MAG: hypothetical protein AAF581_13010 [Planctomycetota bacterium]